MFCPVPGEIPALQTPGEAAFIVQAVLLLGPWDPALADIPPTLHSPAPTLGSSALHGINPGFLKPSQLSFAPLGDEEWGALESSFPAAA